MKSSSGPAAARAMAALPGQILLSIAMASAFGPGAPLASAAVVVSSAGSALRGGAKSQAPPVAAAAAAAVAAPPAQPAASAATAPPSASQQQPQPQQPQPQQPQPQQQHAKLDVGFGDFEENVSQTLAATIKKSVDGPAWTEQLREKLAKNVTDSLHQALQDALKPLKLSIGKTWVALPEDNQKASYVSQLRSGFASTMDRTKDSIEGHVNIGLDRVRTLHLATSAASSTKAASEEELVAKAEQELLGGVFAEHCYDDTHVTKSKTETNGKNGSAALPSKFCIPSVITSFAKRLNDTQGLVGMTMRFEARALDLFQRSKGSKQGTQ